MRYLNSFLIFFNVLSILWFKIGKVEGIIGGDKVFFGQHKYTVSVQENNAHVCGGAIVSVRNVVTAAQCVIKADNNFKENIFSIVAGTINLKGLLFERSKIRVFVRKIYVPREFKHMQPEATLRSHFDIGNIAVLELKEPLNLGLVTKLQLPNRSAAISMRTYMSALLIGFGIDSLSKLQNTYHRSIACHQCDKMTSANVEIVEKTICKALVRQEIHDKHICGKLKQRSPQPAGACEGDIGSPLVLEDNTLVGILCRIDVTCNEKDKPAIYTKVWPYVDFIAEAMEGKIDDKWASMTGYRVAYYKKNGDDTEYLQEFIQIV